MTNQNSQFIPAVFFHPGRILKGELSARNITQAELSLKTGLSKKDISEIINEKQSLTPRTAILLENILNGIPAQFWNNLQTNYTDYKIRKENEEKNRSQLRWLDKMPVKEMIERKLIPSLKDRAKQIESVLAYLGFSSIETFDASNKTLGAAFRKDALYDSSPEHLCVWLREGELKAANIETEKFDRKKLIASLPEIAELSAKENINVSIKRLKEILSSCGIAFVLVKEYKKTQVFGSFRWLTPDRALIQLSLRGKRNDIFWFNLMHEIGHIILGHSKKETFINFSEEKNNNKEEAEANSFAEDKLISRENWQKILVDIKKCRHYKENIPHRILCYARELKIAPAIIAGRLANEAQIKIKDCEGLFESYDFKKS